jgi:hypothetical protein
MRESDLEFIEELESVPVSTWDLLDSPLEHVRAHLEADEDDDLGIRTLYEHPETLVPPSRWPGAA